jgi:hypothetical protein
MCPKSSRAAKEEIHYLSDVELRALRDEVARTRLATFKYKPGQGDTRSHLGVILEDDPSSPAADMARGQVDLYGYSSLAIAASQVQGSEIAELRARIERLEKECAKTAPQR